MAIGRHEAAAVPALLAVPSSAYSCGRIAPTAGCYPSLAPARPPARSAHCALRVFECSCTCTPKSTTALQRRRSAPSAGSSSTPKRRCCVRQQVMLRYCLVAPAQRATEAGQLERQSRIRYRGRVGGLPWGYPGGRNRCAMPVCRSSASTCHVERRARRRTPDGAPRAQRQPSGGHLLVRAHVPPVRQCCAYRTAYIPTTTRSSKSAGRPCRFLCQHEAEPQPKDGLGPAQGC